MDKFEINKRIKELIDFLKLGQNEFAKQIGVSSSRMSNIITNRNKPDSELLQFIAIKFRNVSIEWLLLGLGAMLKSQMGTNCPVCFEKDKIIESLQKDKELAEYQLELFLNSGPNESILDYFNCPKCSEKEKAIVDQAERIEELKYTIALMRSQINASVENTPKHNSA